MMSQSLNTFNRCAIDLYIYSHSYHSGRYDGARLWTIPHYQPAVTNETTSTCFQRLSQMDITTVHGLAAIQLESLDHATLNLAKKNKEKSLPLRRLLASAAS